MRNKSRTRKRANSIRQIAIQVASYSGEAYIGQALGVADILACVFELGIQTENDRFVLSPGHYGLALYAANADSYDFAELCTYGKDGSVFEQSPVEGIPGVEVTGGSLGQGLSQAAGLALGARARGGAGRIFCLISDGELQEGQTWEACLAISHHKLTNLIVLLDRNGVQVDGRTASILNVEPVAAKFTAFGLDVEEVDGHDLDAIEAALLNAMDPANINPRAIIFNTRLGMGVPEFENASYPHYISAASEVWERALHLLQNEPID